MLSAILQIFPLLIGILVGFGLKRIGFLTSKDGSTLFRLLFYIGIPALILTTVPTLELDSSILWLAGLPAVVIAVTLVVLAVIRKTTKLGQLNYKTFGALLAGVIIMNTGFLIPFVEQLYGEAGLARLVIVDAANGFFTFSLVYVAILFVSKKQASASEITQKILAAPPLWALVISLALIGFDAGLPSAVDGLLGFVAGLVSPIILIALGLKFQFKIAKPMLSALALGIRFLFGGLVGLGFVLLLGIEGLDAHIIILASMAPIGFNSILFSDMEKLDTHFAVSQVSLAIIVSIVLIPLLHVGLLQLFPL